MYATSAFPSSSKAQDREAGHGEAGGRPKWGSIEQTYNDSTEQLGSTSSHPSIDPSTSSASGSSFSYSTQSSSFTPLSSSDVRRQGLGSRRRERDPSASSSNDSDENSQQPSQRILHRGPSSPDLSLSFASITGYGGPSSSAQPSPLHPASLTARSIGPLSGRGVDKDLPPPPPSDVQGFHSSYSPHAHPSPGSTARNMPSPTLETSSSMGSPSIRSYLRRPEDSISFSPTTSARSGTSVGEEQHRVDLSTEGGGHSNKGRRWAAGAALGAAGGMSAGLKKLGKVSTSAFRQAAQQQQQWKADRDAAAIATSASRRRRGHPCEDMQTSSGSSHAIRTTSSSSSSNGVSGRHWISNGSKFPGISPRLPGFASSLAPSSSKEKQQAIGEYSPGGWSQDGYHDSLRVPMADSQTGSANHSSRGTSRNSSLSQVDGRDGSIDYAFPPGPIATSDPGIGLPYDVQHNVHVHVGPDGYVGLPASWAEHLALRCTDADVEDDPRLGMESRMEGTYRSRRSRSRRASLDSPNRSPRLRLRRTTAYSDDFDIARVESMAMTDDSSGKRTIRPSMAVSRASTSYSSILHKGWDEWSDTGGRERTVNSPPPPVPPLPSKQQLTPQLASNPHDDIDRQSTEEDWIDDHDDGPARTGLGLDLTNFDLVQTTQHKSNGKAERRQSHKMLLPDFLAGGDKEDEDWALMLLNSIPAADDDVHPPAPAQHLRKLAKPQLRTKSSASSLRSRKSGTASRKSKATPSAHAASEGAREGARTPQSPMISKMPPISTLPALEKKLHPFDHPKGSRPASRASRKSTVRNVTRKGTNAMTASRRTSQRTVKSFATTYASGDEDEWSDGGPYSGTEDGDVQITTATTEKLGMATTVPRALTHRQLVNTVRDFAPSASKLAAVQISQSSAATSPLPVHVTTAVSGKIPSSIDKSALYTTSGSLTPDDRAGDGSLLVDPHLRLDRSAPTSCTTSKSPSRTNDTKSSSNSLKQPDSPGTFMGGVSPSISISQPTSAPTSAISIAEDRLMTSSNKSAQTLLAIESDSNTAAVDRNSTLSVIPSPSNASASPISPSRPAVVPAKTNFGNGTFFGNASQTAGSQGQKVLGLRERRRMKGPSRIYPPPPRHNHNLAPNRSIPAPTGASDLGTIQTDNASNVSLPREAGASEGRARRDSDASLIGSGKGSLRGFFRRDMDLEPPVAPSKASSSARNSPQQHAPLPLHSPHGVFGLNILNAVRKRSASAATDVAPKVPPKDSPAPGSAVKSAGSAGISGSWQGQEKGSQQPKSTQIGLIRPNAHGFFTVSAPTGAGEGVTGVRKRQGSEAGTTMPPTLTVTHQIYSEDVQVPVRTIIPPRSGLENEMDEDEDEDEADETGEEEEEEEEHDYAANEYLDAWMQEGGGSPMSRSPGELSPYSNISPYSNGSGYDRDGFRTAQTFSPVVGNTPSRADMSPAVSDAGDTHLRSPALLSASTSFGRGAGTRADRGSTTSSATDQKDRDLLSPLLNQRSPTFSGQGVPQSPNIDKVQPPIPSPEAPAVSILPSPSSSVGLAYLNSPELDRADESNASRWAVQAQAGPTEEHVLHSRVKVGRDVATTAAADISAARPSPLPSSPGVEVLETVAVPRPSSRVSTSSKTSRRTTARSRRRSADVRNRFPVSTHYASGLSETFFDVSDADGVPRQSFDLDEMLPQHLNDVPPVPPLPIPSNGHHISSPASPMKPVQYIASIPVGAPKSPKAATFNPANGSARARSPSASRAHSRQSSTSTKRSPRRSRSRTQLSLHVATSTAPGLQAVTSTGPEVFDPSKASTIPSPHAAFVAGLPSSVQPAAQFLVPADPEALFSDLNLIGSGDSGDVFSAVGRSKKGTQENLAVKVIKVPKLTSPLSPTSESQSARLEGLSKEITLWSVCTHEKIIGLHEVFFSAAADSSHPGVWITQELADRSLADIVSLHGDGLLIPEVSMAKILFDVLEALQCLHSKLIIHRDVRSDNVLICPNGTAKLSDFTQAVQLTDEKDKRSSTVGIAYWMAPELVASQPYSTEVDIWSLGATLYEMCKGQPPNVDLSPEQAVAATAQHGLPTLDHDIKEESMSWSMELRMFLEMATERDAHKRGTATSLLRSEFIRSRGEETQIVELLEWAGKLEGQLEDDQDGDLEEEESENDDE